MILYSIQTSLIAAYRRPRIHPPESTHLPPHNAHTHQHCPPHPPKRTVGPNHRPRSPVHSPRHRIVGRLIPRIDHPDRHQRNLQTFNNKL